MRAESGAREGRSLRSWSTPVRPPTASRFREAALGALRESDPVSAHAKWGD